MKTLHRVGCPEPASASAPSTNAFATARIGPPSATVSCQYYSPLPTNHRACYQLLRLLTSAEEPINIRSHRHDATTGRTLVARYPPITVPAGLKIVHPPSAKSQYQPPLLCLLLPAVCPSSQRARWWSACLLVPLCARYFRPVRACWWVAYPMSFLRRVLKEPNPTI